ncbi:hypothetical protein CPLU01_02739 [Colletotrichum plurivorum]|uniref:Nephrocystin 3-like N-terminal domain-containing protein n=1 Tax=Colletotrichum plurivorum TaxID=2175906 RepID=A0A8H6KV29_9PEZI|nr:hypothetical protein CPLU01_02739 [Colletotrichum plurivorum]
MRGLHKPRGFMQLHRPHWRWRSKDVSPRPEDVNSFARDMPTFRAAPPGPTQWDENEQRFRPEDELGAEYTTETKVEHVSWDLLFDQMAAAKKAHEEKSGLASKAALGADMLSDYINLIPDEFGLGILKGGLSLIFGAVIKHEENRAKILDTFETLPDSILTINTACALLEPGPAEEKLEEEVRSMLFRDIPVLVKILLGKEPWYRDIMGFLTLRIPETTKIDDILSSWDQKITQLKGHVKRMKMQLLSKFSGKLDDISTQIESSSMGIRTLLSDNLVIVQAISSAVMQQHEMIKSGFSRQDAAFSRQDARFANVETILHELIAGQRRDDEHERRESDLRRELELRERENSTLVRQINALSREASENSIESRRHRSGIEPIQLIGILGVLGDEHWGDLEFVTRQSVHFSDSDMGRTQWLAQASDFRGWLREESSSLLLVDGWGNPHRTSPLSGFCASLVKTLFSDDRSEVAFFFAGLHVDGASRLNGGPTAMMRSLIAQILLSRRIPPPDLGFLSPDMLEACRYGDLRTLCDVFVEIVEQVPSHMTVFCIVDGVSWYEQHPWRADLHCVATMFEELIKSSLAGRSGRLKVIFTSPDRSTDIVQQVRRPERLWWYVSLATGHAHHHSASMMMPGMMYR